MANPRVVELRQQAPTAHPAPQRSNQKKRKRPEHTTVQSNATQRSATGENNSAVGNQSKQSIHPSKRQHRRQGVQRSGKTPHPEDVIVIDSDGEEATTRPATNTAPSSSGSSTNTRPIRASAAPMEHLDSDDYFEVLGLSRDASDADVKKAYRKLAIQWHPDKNREHPRAEEFFKKIGEAYAVLSDPEKRSAYERYGKSGLNAGSSGSPDRSSRASPDDFGFSSQSEFSARRARDIFEAFFGGMDPFAELFGGHARRASRHSHGFPNDGLDDDIGDRGFGPAFVMPLMMGLGRGGMGVSVSFGGSHRGFGGGLGGIGGFGGGGLLDSFFSDEFPGFGAAGVAGGRGFVSHSVSTSSFTDRNGQTVTKKTTTTTSPEGRTETVTEEYRNGNLVNSSSRLAGAGRMQLDSGGTASPAPSSRDGQRRLQSGGRSQSNRAV